MYSTQTYLYNFLQKVVEIYIAHIQETDIEIVHENNYGIVILTLFGYLEI